MAFFLSFFTRDATLGDGTTVKGKKKTVIFACSLDGLDECTSVPTQTCPLIRLIILLSQEKTDLGRQRGENKKMESKGWRRV